MSLSRVVFSKPEHVMRLRDYPPLLHKTELFIEEPRGKYQWSLWYGTNWRGFPVRMPKYNMHPVASHEGQEALRVMDQTHEELDGGRGT